MSCMTCCRAGQRRTIGNRVEKGEHERFPDNVELFRRFWDEKLREVVDLIYTKSDSTRNSDVFHILLQLYAHKNVVEELYSCYEDDAQSVSL
jgi:hypothetical protein